MDVRKIVKAAKSQGWHEDRTTRGHVRLTPADKAKEPSIFSGTPSDVKAIRNFLSHLRRNGFIWPPPGKGQR